jgi:hypothetical protein
MELSWQHRLTNAGDKYPRFRAIHEREVTNDESLRFWLVGNPEIEPFLQGFSFSTYGLPVRTKPLARRTLRRG